MSTSRRHYIRRVDTKDVVQYIRDFTQEHGTPPTLRQIGEGVGIKSLSHVHKLLQECIEQGLIRHEQTGGRSYVSTGTNHPSD